MAQHDSETSQGIPIIVRQADPSLSIPSSYSTTPHGTIFSTTPGGTRIIYDRNALMHLRQSPLARTPPNSLCSVPGITKRFPASFHTTTIPSNHTHLKNSFSPPAVMSDLHHTPNKQSHDLSAVEETSGEQLKGDSGEMFHMELE